jgi:beta-lactamase regulating signal transducer with metallopeptidase domain
LTGPPILLATLRAALPFIPTLVAGSLRVSILLAVAFGALWIMKDAPAKLRHILWLSAIGGNVFAFALSLTGPVFHVAFPRGVAGYRGALAALSSALLPATGTFAVSGGMPPLAAQEWRQISMGREWFSLWPSAVLLVWTVGALSGWLRVIWCRLRLLSLARESRDAAHEYQRMVRRLSRSVGIRRVVRVVESGQSYTPLTCGIVHPVIFLPSGMRGWSSTRKRSVLLHELRHVRRGDSCSLAIAYGICSLLWFVPPVWVAYARLYLEQEKACDASVIESGVRPRAYAYSILEAAQLSREPARPFLMMP